MGRSLLFSGSPNKGARKRLRDAVCLRSFTLVPSQFSHKTWGPLVLAQGTWLSGMVGQLTLTGLPGAGQPPSAHLPCQLLIDVFTLQVAWGCVG